MRAYQNHEVWAEIAPEITPGEFNFPYHMNVGTLLRLSRARRRSRIPFRFVSDHRPSSANSTAGGARRSAHMGTPTHAVDLRVQNSRERFKIVEAALAEGFTRIGIYPPTAFQRQIWGKNAGSVHLDDSPVHTRQVMWVSS